MYPQVKFSELTIDMYRMLQALEWERDTNTATTELGQEQPNGQLSNVVI